LELTHFKIHFDNPLQPQIIKLSKKIGIISTLGPATN